VFGEHGLPFIGSGDWNDGMDRVGNHGKGESIWLAFFLYEVLIKFIDMAAIKNDASFKEICSYRASQLRININDNAWDGEWYRRAYFDDGTPLGSAQNDECKIDSIAQSWSVLSGAGEQGKRERAMDAAEKFLVKKADGIIQLFDPPFDNSALNPGYIKGYVPGVRENGGQYTHAAIWLIMAFAELGDTKRTWELLQMINPLIRGKDAAAIDKYETEPYVMAADVYAEPLHKGKGGWTWYTGSAGWMYQLILSSFIGMKREGDKLFFTPCIPKEWPSIRLRYRFVNTVYQIEILQPVADADTRILVNGIEESNAHVFLEDDGLVHDVKVITGMNANKSPETSMKMTPHLSQ